MILFKYTNVASNALLVDIQPFGAQHLCKKREDALASSLFSAFFRVGFDKGNDCIYNHNDEN